MKLGDWLKSVGLSLRSRRQHKAWGGGAAGTPGKAANERKAHEVGDSQRLCRPFHGLGRLRDLLPRVSLSLHPGLYAATRFAGWNKELPKKLLSQLSISALLLAVLLLAA